MRHCYLILLILLLTDITSIGQSISVQENYNSTIRCVGSVMSVTFTTSGTFAADNSFRVQLSDNYGGSYIDLPGSFTSSPASVTLPAASIPGNNYVVRVVATKPLIVSQPSYSFRIATKPTAQITGNSSRNVPLNPYSTVNLAMTLTGGSPYTITLQDSTRYTKYDDYNNSGDFAVSPSRTTTYTLASIKNACGTGPVSGSTTVPVNSVGFQLLARGNENHCLGSQLPVYFSTAEPLPSNTIFEAELVSTYDANRSIALPVSGGVSPLLVTLPAQYIGATTSGYQLRIFSKAANVSAWYRDGSTFSLNSSPRLSISAPATSMPFGGQTSLILSYSTSSAGDVFLSDGQQVPIYDSGSSGSSNTVSVMPVSTTSYSIVSYSGACSGGVSYGNRTATVQVRSGLRIDSLSTMEVCAGQPVTIYYTATPGYVLPSQMAVKFNSGFSAVVTSVKPGQISFTPPTSMSPVAWQPVQLRDSRADTLMAQARQTLTIKTVPSFSFLRPSQTASVAGDQYLDVSYYGGGTTQIILNTGTRLALDGGYYQGYYTQYSIPLYISETTAFSIVSASNQCGTSPYHSATTVFFQNAPVPQTSVSIKAASANLNNNCPGSIQWVNVFPVGVYNADNQFKLEVAGPDGTFPASPVQSFTNAASVSFTLPAQPGTYRVRVSSTSPVTRSNEVGYFVNSLPTATVYMSLPNSSGLSGSVTTVAGQLVSTNYSISGGRSPYQYELVTGLKGLTDYSFQATYQPTSSTDYGFLRVTDACGTRATITGVSPTVTVVPALVRTGSVNSSPVCVQAPVLVPFAKFGSVPASASFVVQLSEDAQTWQTVPTSGGSSPLMAVVPASLANKQVYYRVSYLVDGQLTVGVRADGQLQIRSTPDMVLTTPSGATAVQIDRSSHSSAELRLLDLSSASTAILTSGTTMIKASVYASGISYYVSEPGTYSIVNAYNSCGYGRSTGTVKVTEKPYLTLLRANRTSACVGQTVSFTYAAAGDYNPGNKLSIYLVDNYASSSSKSLLTETTSLSGVYSFTLSQSLKPSSYSIQFDASSPAATLPGFILAVDAPVSATLLPGGAGVFYQTDTQYMRLLSTAATSYSLTLATPTGQVMINPGYSIYDFAVQMTQSGSYSIVSVANQCGAGRATGLYSVSVIPAASVTIRPTFYGGPFCTGKEYQVYVNTTGVFSTSNTFTAYLSDSTGSNVRTLPTVSSASQLTVIIPAGIPDGDRYLIRVGSSSPQHLGASLVQNISIRQSPTGALTGNTSIFKGDSTRISVALTGTPPWRFVLTDFFGPRTFTTSTTPYTLTVKPDTTVGFRLTEVSNTQCGVGTATGTALITVTKLLATEPALPLQVRTWPNPTAGWLLIEGDVPGRGDVLIGVYNAAGTLVQTSIGTVRQGQLQHRIDLSTQAAGVYILTAEQEGRRSQFKVLKE